MSQDLTANLPVEVAHLSDTHLGLEAYRALTPAGDNLRALDMVRAFSNTVNDIVSWDPALVIHSGDAFDKPQVPTRYLLFFSQMLQKLASIRPDGSRRQVVIISGNHDQPRSRKEICALELFASLPGVHVVTTSWSKIDFPDAGSGAGYPSQTLKDLCVTAIPHDTLKSIEFDQIAPRPGYRDILTTHGVAAGSDLYARSLGREYPVPVEILNKDWAYVALGHYHKQGPVSLSGAYAKVTGQNQSPDQQIGRIWYAGSTENCSFRDLRDNGEQRGYLRVTIPPQISELPQITRMHLPIRAMFRLPLLNATGLTPQTIAEELIYRIKQARVQGAIVGQIVEGVSRELWSLVDLNLVKLAAAEAMYYELIPKYDLAPTSRETNSAGLLGDLPKALEAAAQSRLSGDQIKPALELAKTLLGKALKDISNENLTDALLAHASDDKNQPLPKLQTALDDTQHLSPENTDALAASSIPSVAASRIGRDGKATKTVKKASQSSKLLNETQKGGPE